MTTEAAKKIPELVASQTPPLIPLFMSPAVITVFFIHELVFTE